MMETNKEKNSKFGVVGKLYHDSIKWLSSHKWPAFFLAHGGIHILLLIGCIIGAFFMYNEIQSYNKRTFRQFSFRIEGDTLHNYNLSHVSMHIVRATNNNDKKLGYIEGINYHFKYGERRDSISPLNTLVCNIKPYEGLNVDAIQKITLCFDDSTFFESIPPQKEGIKRPEDITNHETAKFGGDYYESKIKSSHYHAFTADDPIKEDKIAFTGPNITNNWEDNNPYLCCFYGIHAVPGSYNLDDNSIIIIQYNHYPYMEGPNSTGSQNDMFVEAPMTVESIYPQPTELTIENIIYRGKDVEKVFEQGGVYVTAVDPIKKANGDRMEFLWTVLIGTIIAFSLDIIVQLVIKWRKL